MNVVMIESQQTMTSREIADLAKKRHDNVVPICKELRDSGVCPEIQETPYVNEQNGQTYTQFTLSKRDSYVLMARLSPEYTARLVDRWQELEGKAVGAIPNFSNPAAAARAWAEQYEARLIAESTKAQIGNRREATAMNTASQAVKKADRLEIELDKSKQYASVKRMEMLYHGQSFNWRLLKSAANEMGIPAVDVFDANYGTVKAYHADVWQEAYAVSISAELLAA